MCEDNNHLYPKLSPTLDRVFRRLFGDPNDTRPLLDLLNAILNWSPPLTEVAIMGSEVFGEGANDKSPMLDIRARDSQNRLYNIEIQIVNQQFYTERATYYLSKLHATQLKKGDHYNRLRPTIGIHLIDWNLITDHDDAGDDEQERYHFIYNLRQEQTQRLLTNHLELHMLQLRTFAKTLNDLTTEQERWLYFIRFGSTLTPNQVDVMGENIKRAEQKLVRISQEEELRYIYDSIEKQQRDESALIQDHIAFAEQQKQRFEEKIDALKREHMQAEQQRAQAEQQRAQDLAAIVRYRLGRDLASNEHDRLNEELTQGKHSNLTTHILALSPEALARWLT